MTEQKTPTAAEIKLNHERTVKAVERLNNRAYSGTKYEAVLPEGQTGIIVRLSRPYGSRFDAPYTEQFRYTTRIDQTIGHPVTYDNKYNESNRGTMCKGIYSAEEQEARNLKHLRDLENDVTKLEAQLEQAKAAVAAQKARLGK